MRHFTLFVFGAALLAGSPAVAGQDDTAIFVTTAEFGRGGSLVTMQRQPPWDTATVAGLDSPDATVQSFAGEIYVVEPGTGMVRVFDGAGAEVRSFSVGPGTMPRDILGVARNRAYVTRAGSAHLYRVDPQTGAGADVVDLGGLAGPDGIPDMERMATDGSRLFVQLRLFEDGVPTDDGAIAVVDLETESLIGAIDLLGPAPRLRMHVDSDSGFMLVSATNGDHLSLGGGIELVDLDTLTSQGFVLDELQFAALGGFAMKDAVHGYYVFHTDIIPSNHLQKFTIAGGPVQGPEIVFNAGVYLDALLLDDETDLLYMPSADMGMHVVDTATDQELTKGPLPLPGYPMDQVIGPIGSRFDLTGDGAVGTEDLLELLASWGGCPATPCPPTCLADIAGEGGEPGADCTVNTADLLLLLANWEP